MGLAEFSVTPLCWRLLVAALITHCLVWAIIILRLYCRVTYNIKAFWEDLFVIIATLTTTVILALSSICKLVNPNPNPCGFSMLTLI